MGFELWHVEHRETHFSEDFLSRTPFTTSALGHKFDSASHFPFIATLYCHFQWFTPHTHMHPLPSFRDTWDWSQDPDSILWDETPVVIRHLEFSHRCLTFYFSLLLFSPTRSCQDERHKPWNVTFVFLHST